MDGQISSAMETLLQQRNGLLRNANILYTSFGVQSIPSVHRGCRPFSSNFCVVNFHPNKCVPADSVDRDIQWNILTATIDSRGYYQETKKMTNLTYENYISTLTKARKRFFVWSLPHGGKDFQEVIGYIKLGIKEKSYSKSPRMED